VLDKNPQTLADLLCEETMNRFAEWLLVEREVDPQTVVACLRMIPPLVKHPLLKGQDFKWVRDIVSDLPPHSDNKVKERKQRKFVRFDVLAKVIGQLIKKANATTDTRKKAILIRNALLIKFFLILAWRQRNVRECRFAPSSAGGNIFKEEIPPLSTMALPSSVETVLRANPHATFWQISFDSSGTKSKRPVRAVLPRQLIPLLERYIELRPALLGPGAADPGTLFLNDHGKPLTAGTLAHHVAGITSRFVGKRVNPHLFRDIHAEWWLASGRGIDDLSNTLWHRDSSFTRQVYGGMFDESHGTKAVEEWLDKTVLDDTMGGESSTSQRRG
jgi:integrase